MPDLEAKPYRHAACGPMKAEYLYGYPQAASGVVARELLRCAVSCSLFLIAPAVAAWCSFTSPWRLVGIPLGAVLAGVAVWACCALVADVRARFGLRVVPQFERKLEPAPKTYFSGRHIAARMRELDAMAAASGARSLSEYGFIRREHDDSEQWFDPADGTATVRRMLELLAPSSAEHAELSTLMHALQQAAADGVRFRLVVVSGTAMNGMLWTRLRAAGF